MEATRTRSRINWRNGGLVTITMTMDEFRETVEWLEMLDPRDEATKEWRHELDRIDPYIEE